MFIFIYVYFVSGLLTNQPSTPHPPTLHREAYRILTWSSSSSYNSYYSTRLLFPLLCAHERYGGLHTAATYPSCPPCVGICLTPLHHPHRQKRAHHKKIVFIVRGGGATQRNFMGARVWVVKTKTQQKKRNIAQRPYT